MTRRRDITTLGAPVSSTESSSGHRHAGTHALAPEMLALSLSPAAVIRCNEPLAGHTTMRVGGPADLYVEPASDADLAAVLAFCAERRLAWFILGRGSNLLVKDGGFRGVVLCLAQSHFTRVEVIGHRLHCGAGARLKAVASEARRNALADLEFLEGIPGSVGGALRMNAGAMGGAIFDFVESVKTMDSSGAISQRQGSEFAAQYRSCPSLRTQLALSAILRARPDRLGSIEERTNEYNERRWSSQPAAPSAGCIFKNPRLVPAGKLIDELGLKGARVGGAHVSVEHGNFIVNDGAATARDVLELIELVRRAAREKRGIDLETEVEIVGECLRS